MKYKNSKHKVNIEKCRIIIISNQHLKLVIEYEFVKHSLRNIYSIPSYYILFREPKLQHLSEYCEKDEQNQSWSGGI